MPHVNVRLMIMLTLDDTVKRASSFQSKGSIKFSVFGNLIHSANKIDSKVLKICVHKFLFIVIYGIKKSKPNNKTPYIYRYIQMHLKAQKEKKNICSNNELT